MNQNNHLIKHLHPWGRSRPFNDFPGYFKSIFAERVQKISIDAGFTCPNRDGTKSTGGCSFCDNKTFNPVYCLPEKSISDQLNQGISFFKKRYPGQKYLAYFQAYSNTYASIEVLQARYEEALAHPEVVGLVIGTRPDCISLDIVDYLDKLGKDYFISLEFGIESTNDQTLQKINRGHTHTETISALSLCQNKSFYTGVHLILGLPDEDYDVMLKHTDELNKLSFNFLKIHQLQFIRNTKLGKDYEAHPSKYKPFGVDEYLDLLIRFIEKLKPELVLERFISESPPDKLLAPKWGLKNFEFVSKLENEMTRRATYQGRLFSL